MRSSQSSRVWKIILGIIVAVLVLFFIAEIAVRAFIAQEIKSSFREGTPEHAVTQEDAEVHFGATPVLFGLVSRELSHIAIDLPSTLTPDSANIIGSPAARLEASGFALDPDDPWAEELSMTTDLPQAFVRDMLQEQLAAALADSAGGRFADYDGIITISDVTTNAAVGTFDITFSNGAFSVELRPQLIDEHLSFEALSTRLLGRELPDYFSRAVTNAFKQGLGEEVVGPLEIRQFTVTDGGFTVSVHGSNVHLNELPV